jgi:hypothetical protein
VQRQKKKKEAFSSREQHSIHERYMASQGNNVSITAKREDNLSRLLPTSEKSSDVVVGLFSPDRGNAGADGGEDEDAASAEVATCMGEEVEVAS